MAEKRDTVPLLSLIKIPLKENGGVHLQFNAAGNTGNVTTRCHHWKLLCDQDTIIDKK